MLNRLSLAVWLLVILADAAAAGFEDGKRAAMEGDYAGAFEEWRPLAEEGHVEAQFLLGLMYREGRGVTQDFAVAAEWLRKAADQGHMDARFFLASAYRDGAGLPRDHAEAARLFRAAAEQGHAEASFTLGLMYRRGQGVPKDDVVAARWYLHAAALGHGEARFTMGAVSDEGRGVAKDIVRAYAWYSLAADSGVELGVVLKERLGRRMTEGELASARRLLQSWRSGGVIAGEREAAAAEPAAAAEAAQAAVPEEAEATSAEAEGERAEIEVIATVPIDEVAAVVEAARLAEAEPPPPPPPPPTVEGAALAEEAAPSANRAPDPAASVSEEKEEDLASAQSLPSGGETPASWRVRLASYRSPEGPKRGWRLLSEAHPDLLSDLRFSTHRVDLGPEKGVYYRLEAGPLSDRATAGALCQALKRRQLECVVVAP